MAEKGPSLERPERGLFKVGFETFGESVMREALRRIVAMDRVACHVERSAGTGAMVALDWHRKHIEERTGRGILPMIRLRKMNVLQQNCVSEAELEKTRL